MKKSVAILLALILVTVFIASCSSYSGDASEPDYTLGRQDGASGGGPGAVPPAAPAEGDPGGEGQTNSGSGSGVIPITSQTGQSWAEKIIYTVRADVETLEYEVTIQRVYDIMELNGAFIENANVGGVNLEQRRFDWQPMRKATFSIRVPVVMLNAVTASLESLGNITNLNSSADNVTSQFSDTESRLNSLKLQEERLLDMLSQAAKIDDMLDIEERLAGIRYQIEGLTKSLRDWQNQVDYSTVHLNITEVKIFTEPVDDEEEVELTYWQTIGAGISASARGVARFFMSIFSWVAINLPTLAIVAAFIFVFVIIIRRSIKRNAKRRENRARNHPSAPVSQYNYGNPPAPGYPQAPNYTAAPSNTQNPVNSHQTNNAPATQQTLEQQRGPNDEKAE